MIKIRNGVWETNSSSTHALCIHKEKELKLLDYVFFGLENVEDIWYDDANVQTRANYLNTFMFCTRTKTDYINWQLRMKKLLKNYGVRAEWQKLKWLENGNPYGADDYSFSGAPYPHMNDLLDNDDALLQFLFGSESAVIYGYDSEYNENMENYKQDHPEGNEFHYITY